MGRVRGQHRLGWRSAKVGSEVSKGKSCQGILMKSDWKMNCLNEELDSTLAS